ncbi:hypothetical protein ACQP1W_01020 [Spirillospora sp. CA-255316]
MKIGGKDNVATREPLARPLFEDQLRIVQATGLAAELGIVLNKATSAQAATVAVAVVAGAYYALVRALEARWPIVGTLLGSARTPAYEKPYRLPR